MALETKVFEIPTDDKGNHYRATNYSPQREVLDESEKTPAWYYKNLRYYLSFYNRPIGSIRFDATPPDQRQASNIPEWERLYPVQHMLRMTMYYLGKQPNLDYQWITQDVGETNLQAMWIKGSNVSEFVNYFRGLIIQRLSNAEFSARAISRDSSNAYQEMVDKVFMRYMLDPVFKQMAEQSGMEFNPMPQAQVQVPEDIEREVSKKFVHRNSEIASYLANGIFFSNGWYQKLIQQFMHATICGRCFMEHYVENGRSLQRTLLPWQVIYDNRIDDDYGRYDKFRGRIDLLTPGDVLRKYPQMLPYMDELEKIANSNSLQKPYQIDTQNVLWWTTNNNNNMQNTVTAVTMYWRGPRDVKKVLAKNKYGNPTVRGTQPGERGYEIEDIHCVTVIGNKWIVEYGYPDNIVEDPHEKNIPMFPISKFQPNTFMGDNVSEVAKIHKIQDEMDMLDWKIRDMVGKAKGKVYIVHGDKIPDGVGMKEFFQNLGTMGVQVVHGTGEDEPNQDNRGLVEMIDWTLDPNIYRLADLYKEREERMGRILSTSAVSLGQVTRYIGAGQQQSTINQNTLGVTYMIDGFLDYVVSNMRYAANQQKSLKTIKERDSLQMLIGKDGVKWLEFTKDMKYEELFIELLINDSIDQGGRDRLIKYAQAWSQNPAESGVTPLSILKLEKARSWSEGESILEYDVKKGMLQNQQIRAQQEQIQQQMEQLAEKNRQEMAFVFQQFKEDNENYRKQLEVFAKLVPSLQQVLQNVQQVPPITQEQQSLFPPQPQPGQGMPEQQPEQIGQQPAAQ